MKHHLTRKLITRGYKQTEIEQEIKDIRFSSRQTSLTKTTKPKQNKTVFITQFCDDTQRIKQILYKHWKPIQKDPFLRAIFPTPPTIAFRTSQNLRKKLVRAKLKPILEQSAATIETINPSDKQEQTPNPNPNLDQTMTNTLTETTSTEYQTHKPNPYPYNLFKESQQQFRNPTKRCKQNCTICKHVSTKTLATSTVKGTKYAIDLPQTNEHYNCSSKNIVYLITCNNPSCRTQYVGYTKRPCKQRLLEHLTAKNSPIQQHLDKTKHNPRNIEIQILTQAPSNEMNKELWLKRQEYNWICKLATLTKTSNKGLNKTIYDSTSRETMRPITASLARVIPTHHWLSHLI